MGNENSKCGCCKNNKINEIQFNQENIDQNIQNSSRSRNVSKIDGSKDLKSYVTNKNNIENSISHDENSFNNKKSSSISNNNKNNNNLDNTKISKDEDKFEYDSNILSNNKKKTSMLVKQNAKNNVKMNNTASTKDNTKENINNQKLNLKANINKENNLNNNNRYA